MNLTIEDTKNKMWLANNKVCFVTNSNAMPSTLLLTSLKTYIDYIPIQNFWIIPGVRNNEPFYGLQAFVVMLEYMLTTNRFDYVIYIDEDCFINDFQALIDEFKIFLKSDCCLAGSQDGGVICHRNHSKLLINTFLSFWNIKLIKEKKVLITDIINYINTNIKDHADNMFEEFLINLQDENKKLYNLMYETADINIKNVKEFRMKYFINGEVPYCETVKNDVTNLVEQHQEPYTFDDNKALTNFEPYYVLEEALIMLTKTPIYYLFTTDYYDPDDKNNPLSHYNGLTSAVYYRKPMKGEYKLICVHTWYSRAYTKWPTMQVQLDQTKRINTIIKKYSRI